jgi:hypothetical protein
MTSLSEGETQALKTEWLQKQDNFASQVILARRSQLFHKHTGYLFYSRCSIQKTNSVALSPRANYTDWRPPLVDEI